MEEKCIANNRIEWVDIAKGITILTVIYGHMISMSRTFWIVRGIFYSFHMPLFFILSCYTFKFSENNTQFIKKTEKAFKRLMFPFFIVFILNTLIEILLTINKGNALASTFFFDKVNALIYGSCSQFIAMGTIIPGIGYAWFLVSLFGGKTLFDYLHLKLSHDVFLVAIFASCILGVWLGEHQWLPFTFDIVLAIQPFFLFGHYLKRFDFNNKRVLGCLLSFLVWATLLSTSFVLTETYIEIAGRRYTLFPLCHVTAIAGAMFVCYISVFLSKHAKLLKYIGKNSMWMLFIHIFEEYFSWKITNNVFINGVIRVISDICIFLVLMQIIKLINLLKKNPNGNQYV